MIVSSEDAGLTVRLPSTACALNLAIDNNL
jgi:hypothetical protein